MLTPRIYNMIRFGFVHFFLKRHPSTRVCNVGISLCHPLTWRAPMWRKMVHLIHRSSSIVQRRTSSAKQRTFVPWQLPRWWAWNGVKLLGNSHIHRIRTFVKMFCTFAILMARTPAIRLARMYVCHAFIFVSICTHFIPRNTKIAVDS